MGAAQAGSYGWGVGRLGFWRSPIQRPRILQPPTLCRGPYRQVHKAQGGDDAADEADNEGAVRHEHHLSGGAHGHSSSQRGILDVHLGGVGRAGRKSVLLQSIGLEELTQRHCVWVPPGPEARAGSEGT